jgi:hypothetical protein
MCALRPETPKEKVLQGAKAEIIAISREIRPQHRHYAATEMFSVPQAKRYLLQIFVLIGN